MRQSIDQISMKPRCYLIDTENWVIELHYYEIENGVFTVPDKEAENSVDLDGLVKALKESGLSKASYKRDCIALADSEEVKHTITEIFDDLD